MSRDGKSSTVEWQEFWSGFDWEKKRPKGRSLKDRGIFNAHRDGRTYYQLYFREEYVEVSPIADELVRRVLIRVDEYANGDMHTPSRSEEMSIELPLPRKKPAVHSDDPDFF